MTKKPTKLLLRLALGIGVPVTLLTTGSLIRSATFDVISDGSFERGLSPWQAEPEATKTCCSHSLKIVNSPTRAGSHAAQFTLDRSDNAKRAELRSVDLVPPNSEAWYGFSIYLPSNWAPDKSFDIVSQWGARPDFSLGETHRIPPLALMIRDKSWGIHRSWDLEPVTKHGGRKGGREGIKLGPYQTGVWTDWVFHVKWSYQSDGLLEVWKNGKLVVSRSGPNIYNDRSGPFFNTGIYKPEWQSDPRVSTTNQRVIYFDEVRIGNASASYQAVAPGS